MVVYAVAIGLSAFLLFWLEPLIGQIVLPLYGGTPAVWATVLMFFQGTLLLGYLYSHASVTRLGRRWAAVVHVGLAIGATVWLLVGPGSTDHFPSANIPAALDVLRVLAIKVGPPAFVLTATTPLLSAWFASGHHAEGRGDPYWLYALSNAASLAALLAYPFLIGPVVGLSRQEDLWSIAFVVLCLVVSIAAVAALRTSRATGVARPWVSDEAVRARLDVKDAPGRATSARAVETGWPRRFRWLLLAAVPAGLLAAVTNFIAVDLIAAPLLWIGPLALYLGSFIVAFSARGRRLVPGAIFLAPAAVTLLWVPIGSVGGWPLVPLVALEWGGLAIIATALHGRLAQDRPPAERLTEFYLTQSVGGVTGGAFVAVVAPMVFPSVWEYPILLAAALGALAVTGPRRDRQDFTVSQERRGARPRLNLRPFVTGAPGRVGPYAAAAVILVGIMAFDRSVALGVAPRWLLVGGILLVLGAQPRFLAVSTALILAVATFVTPAPALLRDRSFFGVTEVLRSTEARITVLMNGTTLHGTQSTDPAFRRRPTTYYASSGPLGDVFSWLAEARPNASIAAVGLGAGTVAAYEQSGQTMTFFEIDPLVVRVATDPQLFTYLADAPNRPAIVLGDARLSIRDTPSGSFDLLILDAFSSDAIPTHLVTLEALTDDLRVLRPGGLVVIHVSNRYYDLGPALAAAGERLGLTALEKGYSATEAESEAGAAISGWVALASDQPTADLLRANGWATVRHDGVVPLTDDHPDILRFLSIGR